MTYRVGPARFSARNMTAKQLLLLSRQVGGNFQELAAPEGWFSVTPFDIEATAESPISWAAIQVRLRSLLADRFKLMSHSERRQGAVYNLVPSKGGMKIRLSSDQTPWAGDNPDDISAAGADMLVQAGSVSGDAIPMALFINFLSSELSRTVINKTDRREDTVLNYSGIQLSWSRVH